MANRPTDGNIIIQKSANGYVVVLPIKEQSPTSGIFNEAMGEIKKLLGKGDIEEILQNQEKEQADGVFEMEVFDNVFCFRNFEAVLSFLQKMFLQTPNTDKQ